MSKKLKGKYGEELAADYLVKKGYKIIDTNYHYKRYGEIDIIAIDKGTLCFVEVKTRTSLVFGNPLESITKEKLRKISLCMYNYLLTSDTKYKNSRIDAISVYFKGDIDSTKPTIEHIKNIEF